MPRVSVIIPTFNHASFIRSTLESVFAQDFGDCQIIVVNDGSIDDTAEVLRPFVADHQIDYIEQPNGGQASARNRGLSVAIGEYIAFLDDDDYWPADKLRWQVSAMDANPDIDAVAGRAQFVDADDRAQAYVSEWLPKLTYRNLFSGNIIISPGQVLIRASALSQVGGLDASLWGADDWDLWFKLAKEKPIAMYDRIALNYRVHSENATKQGRRLYLNSRLAVERQLCRLPGPERREMRRNSYRFLCKAWASWLVSEAKESIRAGRWQTAGEDVVALSLLLRGFPVLPALPFSILLEVIPVRLRLAFNRLMTRRSGRLVTPLPLSLPEQRPGSSADLH